MVTESELYPAVEALFEDKHIMGKEIALGSKRIDLVCVDKDSGKLIAVELKVKNWKRAMHQAWVYRTCANEAYIAIPEDRLGLLDSRMLSAYGLGVIAIPASGSARIAITAPQSQPISENSNILIRASVIAGAARQTTPREPPQPSAFKYYLWYIAQDRALFEEFAHVYDGFFINAHILAHYQSAFSALCLTLHKPFFVIPDTHFFQHAPPRYFFDDKGELRISWQKLLDEYEGVVKHAIENGRNLDVSDLDLASENGRQNLRLLTRQTIESQRRRFAEGIGGLAWLAETEEEQTCRQNIVAPYFHFSTPTDQWYPISVQATREAVALRSNNDSLFAVLCIDKDTLLDEGCLGRIRDDYTSVNVDGFLVWVSGFDETAEPLSLLQGLKTLIRMLSSDGKKVINLHGGYYSMLLHHFGLSGFASGICHKDSADAETFPTGGPPGGPEPRYYLPSFKVKLDRAEARITLAMHPGIACTCDICSSQLIQMLDPSTPKTVSRQAMRQHYLKCRNTEMTGLGTRTLAQEISDLDSTFRRYGNARGREPSTLPPVIQLTRWSNALRSNLNSV
jgi:hypothetical protein